MTKLCRKAIIFANVPARGNMRKRNPDIHADEAAGRKSVRDDAMRKPRAACFLLCISNTIRIRSGKREILALTIRLRSCSLLAVKLCWPLGRGVSGKRSARNASPLIII